MQSPFDDKNDLLDKTATARHLGIAPRTLDLWIKQRRIPYIKLGPTKGSLIRFKREDIEEMLQGCRVSSLPTH